ncbi:MAG: hypothetical protein Q4G42_02125 [Neisseria sp.]|nr:hypothetical protein [Neisseria sp.]
MVTTFSIATLDGAHIGFLLITRDDAQQESGGLMIKVQVADPEVSHRPEVRALARSAQAYFVWRLEDALLNIYDDHGEETAQIQGEYLQYCGYTYSLNELVGVW